MLELYAIAGCPYCQKVIDKLYELNLSFVYHPQKAEEGEESAGFKVGGKTQAPLLVDKERDVKMYESDDIVNYLEEHYS